MYAETFPEIDDAFLDVLKDNMAGNPMDEQLPAAQGSKKDPKVHFGLGQELCNSLSKLSSDERLAWPLQLAIDQGGRRGSKVMGACIRGSF